MAKRPDADLFESTSMTFGEHLEELRVCLVRALMGLAVGMLIGFLIADRVVVWIESPLTQALDKFQSDLAERRLFEAYGTDVSPELSAIAAEEKLIFEEVYFEKEELQWLLNNAQTAPRTPESEAPESEAQINQAQTSSKRARSTLELSTRTLPSPTRNFVKTRIWKSADAELTVLSPQEPFMIWLKAAAVSGLLVACPYMFFQIWLFVAAGLYPNEKRYVYVFLPFSVVLFLSGAALAFFCVFGPVLEFLFSFASWMNIKPDLRISEVISFVLILPLGFGVAFQLPLVMLFINRIGIVTIAGYLEKWRIAILVIFVISMLLTPADPVSMLLMALPLIGLYFLGIALCKWMPRGRNPFDEAYEP